MSDDHDEKNVPHFEKPVDQLPGTSHNIMATFYRDELRTQPRKRSWPLLISPLVLVVLIVGAILLFR